MQTLTYEEVRAAARRAYENGTLLALRKERGEYTDSCVYAWQDVRCAVGAALNEESLRAISEDYGLNGLTVDQLQSAEVVKCGSDFAQIKQLQMAHDNWMTCEDKYVSTTKSLFLKLIGIINA